MKYHIIIFGCQMNISDSERVASVLESKKYIKTSNINEADLIVVVMCSVRQSAVDRVVGLTRKFEQIRKINPGLKTILTGCVLKKDKKIFVKEFDEIIDIKDIASMDIASKKPTKNRAFLPISNGCDNFCTYCVVPYTRGRLNCRDHNEIIKDAKKLAKQGFKEIWLLGQNVNDYTSPKDKSIYFVKLFQFVNEIPGDFKIFFMSPNPKNFSDELISALAEAKKFSRYLNLPIQSGDNEILKKMNRPYTREKYIALVKKLRAKLPDLNLSTDVIVGFPGETKKQFENTANLFREIKFNIAYINKYSPRFGTAAAKLKDNVPWLEKKRREKVLMDTVNEKRK